MVSLILKQIYLANKTLTLWAREDLGVVARRGNSRALELKPYHQMQVWSEGGVLPLLQENAGCVFSLLTKLKVGELH